MNLTAKQIKWLDEISRDKCAIEATLRIAMVYHSNRTNEIRVEEDKFWKELKEIHDLPYDKLWKVKRVRNEVAIVEDCREETP